jgi:hypothetical protein
MLEPCEVKVSRTVLRGERGREASDLPDQRKTMILATDVRCFISYRHEQLQKPFAHLLSKRLCRYAGIHTWIDLKNVRVGGKLSELLERGIASETDLFIPILTNEYLDSANCQMELKYAIALGRKLLKPILPLVLLPCRIPMILEDIVWGDFRDVYDESGKLDQSRFNKSLRKLVTDIRYYGKQSNRIVKIKSSSVRAVEDLWCHLLWRIKDETQGSSAWALTEELFCLYCDIIQDRQFPVSPVDQFFADLFLIVNKDKFVEVSQVKTNFHYLKHYVTSVPKELRLTEMGSRFIRDSASMRYW